MGMYVLEVKSPIEWNQLASIMHSKGIKPLGDIRVDTSLSKVLCNGMSYVSISADFKQAPEFTPVKLQDLYNLI